MHFPALHPRILISSRLGFKHFAVLHWTVFGDGSRVRLGVLRRVVFGGGVWMKPAGSLGYVNLYGSFM